MLLIPKHWLTKNEIARIQHFYTTDRMTGAFFSDIVLTDKTGPLVRKGKTMKQAPAVSIRNKKRPSDHQGTTMPAARTAERLVLSYSKKVGLSGYPDPGLPLRILD